MIHPITTTDTSEQFYAWITPDGDPVLIGNWQECTALHSALTDFVAEDVMGEPISEFDPAWGHNYTLTQAAAEAVAYGYGDGDERQTANTIRAACVRGAIRGATQVNGKWSIPRRTLRDWLVRASEEKRGRPRKERENT